MREVEAVKGLVELEAVRDGGDLGVVDGEAGDVRVEGDGEGDQAGVGAHHTQLHIVTLTSCIYSECTYMIFTVNGKYWEISQQTRRSILGSVWSK